jgi:AcrR family transcriptional regulator
MADDPLRKEDRYHHGNLAEALVVAAHEMVDEVGIDALTLRSVAQRVGVTHAAPYRHFKDKAALLHAVAERVLVALRAALAFETNIVDAAGAYVEFAIAHREGYRTLLDSAEAMDHLGEAMSALDPRPSVTMAIWSQCHGLAMLANGGRLLSEDPRALARRAADQLVRGLS